MEMRFEPISTYAESYSLARQEAVDAIVKEFGVTSWSMPPNFLSELERSLVFGKTVCRDGDFDMSGRNEIRCKYWTGLLDHAAVFKRDDGATFVITMPYSDSERLLSRFNEMMTEYYEHKKRVSEMRKSGCAPETLKRRHWDDQLAIDPSISPEVELMCVIVGDEYKVRENGSIAAIIGTKKVLEDMGLDTTRRD
jgi:hypothetical protein